MSSFEYTVIPAPVRGEKTRGAKTGIERFAFTLSDALNDMAREGWEYVRAETLPAEERSGLTSRTTVYHNLLVFRRARMAPARDETPEHAPEPAPIAPAPASEPAHDAAPIARGPFSQPMRATPRPDPAPAQSRARMAEPPLTSAPAPIGPRLGPANR